MLTLFRGRCGGEDRGAIAILVAAFAVMMFVFAALIVDLGFARSSRRDAQNAADAAALAAANVLYPGDATPDFNAAVAAAKAYAASNFGTTDVDWTGCTTTEALTYAPAGTSCISFDSATAPENIRVVLPSRLVTSFFGGVVGYTGMEIDALAQARVDRDSTPICAFCVIGPGPHGLQNGDVTMSDGDIWLNGDLDLGPQGDVTASSGTVHVEGTVDVPNQVSDPKIVPDASVSDPLSFLSVPPSDISALALAPKINPCTQGPGYYGAVSLSGNGTCTVQAGLYVFTEALTIGGNHTLVANDVTLYFACGVGGVRTACSTDSAPGRLDASGGSGFTLAAPTSGPRKGLAVAYDRGNPATLSLRGDVSGGAVTGTIYAPDATLDMRGNGCGTTFRSMVVVYGISYSGNPSCFSSLYAPADNVELPPGGVGLVL
ncbi:MAG: pilus assembly protein TadG-related protein [Actinomycetes bacterium]